MLKNKAIAAVGWSALEQVGGQGITVLFTIALARILTPEDFGISSAAFLVTGFFARIAVLGFDSAIVQRNDFDSRILGTAFSIVAPVSVILMITVIMLAPAIATIFHDPRIAPVLSIAALTIVTAGLNGVVSGAMRRELRMDVLAKRTLAANLISGCIAVPLALAGYGVYAIVAQYVLGSILSLIFILAYGGYPVRLTLDRTIAEEMLRFGTPIAATDILHQYNGESPKLFVGLFLGPEALGMMTVALRIMHLLINFVGTTVTRTAIPILAEINRSSDRFNEAYLRLVRLTCAVMIPCFLLLMILREPAVRILLGENWLAAAPVVGVLSGAGILTALNFLNGTTLIAIGRPSADFWFSLGRAAVGTFVLAMASPFGIVASALALLLRGVIIEPLQLGYLLRQLGLQFGSYAEHVRGALIGGTVFAMSGFGAVALTDGLNPLVVTTIVFAITGASYCLYIWIADPALRTEVTSIFSAKRRT